MKENETRKKLTAKPVNGRLIIDPDLEERNPIMGTIMAVSEESKYKVGQIVMFPTLSSKNVKIDNYEYLIVEERNIDCIL